MRKVICDDCGKEYEPPPHDHDDELYYTEDYGIVKDLAKFDGWSITGQFKFCPDCKGDPE